MRSRIRVRQPDGSEIDHSVEHGPAAPVPLPGRRRRVAGWTIVDAIAPDRRRLEGLQRQKARDT